MVCIPTLIFLLEERSVAEADDTLAVIFLAGEASASEAAPGPSPMSVGGRCAFLGLSCLPALTGGCRRGPCLRFQGPAVPDMLTAHSSVLEQGLLAVTSLPAAHSLSAVRVPSAWDKCKSLCKEPLSDRLAPLTHALW